MWGDCSVTCDVGVRTRDRTCGRHGEDGSRGSCTGSNLDISTCKNDFCAGTFSKPSENAIHYTNTALFYFCLCPNMCYAIFRLFIH